jgi:hypothetical protein
VRKRGSLPGKTKSPEERLRDKPAANRTKNTKGRFRMGTGLGLIIDSL